MYIHHPYAQICSTNCSMRYSIRYVVELEVEKYIKSSANNSAHKIRSTTSKEFIANLHAALLRIQIIEKRQSLCVRFEIQRDNN